MVFKTACLVLSLCAGSQQPGDPEATAAGRKAYLGREVAHTMHWSGAGWLMRKTREEEENGIALRRWLAIAPGQSVCDLGCGNGYHTVPLAEAVGAEGRVFAVDLQPQMLVMLEQRTDDAGLDNVRFVEATVDDPKLPAASCDLVLMVDVYHELSHPVRVMQHVRRALKPGGRVVLVEFRAEDPEVPIKPEHMMSKAQVIREMASHGFALSTETDGLPWQHAMAFGAVPERAPEFEAKQLLRGLFAALRRGDRRIVRPFVATGLAVPDDLVAPDDAQLSFTAVDERTVTAAWPRGTAQLQRDPAGRWFVTGLAVTGLAATRLAAQPQPARPQMVRRQLHGFTVHVDPALLDGEHREQGTRALGMLANHLERISLLLRGRQLEDLRKLEIWIEHEHPELRNMQYHPSRRWLEHHGYDPRLAKKVHIPRARALLSREQLLKHPAVVLHELAHAYHDQVLGFADPRIVQAFRKARGARIYEQVLAHTGRKVRHYALTNHKEYFAEMTEAYLYRNDFYPFVRAEFAEVDPNGHAVLREIWDGAQAPQPRKKQLPLPGETFAIDGREAFVIAPPKARQRHPQPWVWYAPTLRGLPSKAETWMFRQLLDAGIAIAGVDVGESYGSPAGRAVYDQLYEQLVRRRGMAPRPCLLARSRGGLMLYSWAAEHPEAVAAIAGIYPACDLRSYPGLDRASGAFGLDAAGLEAALANHNPIERLAPLAAAQVPIFHIHGDADRVVPLPQNSGELARRYRALGGTMTLEVASGQGHNMWNGFFQCQPLVDFLLAHAPPTSTRGVADPTDAQKPAHAVQLVGPNGSAFVPEKPDGEQLWTFADGVLTASPKWDSVVTPESYDDFRMHVEFATNVTDAGNPEARGNSGVYIQQRYEVQILDSHGVSAEDYKASYCGSLYRLKKPDVIACRPAGAWQSYDIVFRAARWNGDQKTEDARITVFHNGQRVHDDFALPRKTGAGAKEGPDARPIRLQGHHNQVRFRNVWIERLDLDGARAQKSR